MEIDVRAVETVLVAFRVMGAGFRVLEGLSQIATYDVFVAVVGTESGSSE